MLNKTKINIYHQLVSSEGSSAGGGVVALALLSACAGAGREPGRAGGHVAGARRLSARRVPPPRALSVRSAVLRYALVYLMFPSPNGECPTSVTDRL
ncbi:hypothetical protein B5X24_HaOG208085 [Helicoverpa armigera]|nr:hypothetical protein B5X24_HaOG208085 [Helicoverpa armigera]